MTQDPFKPFLSVPTPVYAINGAYEIAFSNTDQDMVGRPCYKVIWGRDLICEGCGLKALLQKGTPFKKSGRGKLDGKDTFLACNYSAFENAALCFLQDNTQIISALQQARQKEAQIEKELEETSRKSKASMVMLRHKINTAQKDASLFPKILDGVASGVMVINASFTILRQNKTLGKTLEPFWGEGHQAKTCHQMLYGLSEPCEDCPVKPDRLMSTKRTKNLANARQDGYLTEEFEQMGRDFVVSVTNSTRTIKLAFQISEDQKEMESLNKMLHEVVENGTSLQTEKSPETLLQQVLDILSTVFYPDHEHIKLAILQKQGSRENVKMAVFLNFAENERKKFLAEFQESGEEAYKKLQMHALGIDLEDKMLETIVLIQADPLEEKRETILRIFLNMVGSFLENANLLADLERRASQDGLTGTYNRAYFEKKFDAEKQKADLYGLHFGILVLDINGLKKVNDVYGHLAGDVLIKESGNLLGGLIRNDDVLSRFGGDEYVVLLPSTGIKGTQELSSRIKEAQKGATYCVEDENGDTIKLEIHMSVGCSSSEEVAPDKVFNLADERMYADKELFYQTRERYRV